MTGLRLSSRPVAFGCLLLGGLLALVSSAQPWWRAAGAGAQVEFRGTDATGGLSQALGVVTLAGTLLVLALGVRGRRLLAVLLAATGTGQAVLGVLRLPPSGDAVRARIREVSLVDQYALSATAWPWVFALAGLVVVCGAVALLLGAASSWVRANRFERAAPVPAAAGQDDPAGLWKALDAGLDPTAGSNPATPVDRREPTVRRDPDVRNDDSGDTMVADSRGHQQHSVQHPSGRDEPTTSESQGPNSSGPNTQG